MPRTGQMLKIGVQGDEVTLLHTYLEQLGYANVITAQERHAGSFDKGTAEAVAAFQRSTNLPPTGELDAETAKAINAAVEALQPKPEPREAGVVKGHVRGADGQSFVGVQVQAFDKDLRTEQRLGEPVLADSKGYYEITYTADQFRRAEKDSADLIVRAFPDGSQPVTSDILFNAPPIAVVDLIVPNPKEAGLSEYERFMAEIAPLLENVKVPDLTDDDVAFLSGETGIGRQYVAFLAIAARHGAETELPPEAFYAFAREGLPTSLPAVLAAGTDVQRYALESALRRNTIASRLRDDIDRILAALQWRLVRVALEETETGQSTPLGALLSGVLPAAEQRQTFLALYTNHKGSIEDFWDKELRGHPEFNADGRIEQLQFTLQLGLLTHDNAALVQGLQNTYPKITSTRQLVDLDGTAWSRLIAETTSGGIEHVPPHIAGASPEEKIANYAGEIVETLRATFPTRYVAKGLADRPAVDTLLVREVRDLNEGLDLRQPLPETLNWGDTPAEEQKRARETVELLRGELAMFPALTVDEALGNGGFTNPIRAGVEKVLANDRDFDLGAVDIDAYLERHKDTAFAGVEEDQRGRVTLQLKAMQRVYQVTPRYQEMHALMSAGFDSAAAMSSHPPEPFTKHMSPLVGGELPARLIHEGADRIHAEALTAFGALASVQRELTIRVIGEPRVPEDVRATYRNLFGRLGFCACEHCRSVYSPAAYLVDLLHLLERGPGQLTPRGPARPITVLQWRRPDILHIPLTCENTNTLIPYIDLVNEVLEAYVAYSRVPNRSLGDAGRATSEELLASPQHVEDAAYIELKNAVFPFSLPFDRHLETARAYLEHLGTSLHAVMRTFQRTRPLTADAQTDLAIEYLRIGPEQRDVLTGAAVAGATRTLSELYGYQPGEDGLPPAGLETVAVFLERTGLRYEDLEQLLRTRFINPAGFDHAHAVVVADPTNSCDAGSRYLRVKKDLGLAKDRSLTEKHWDRLQRFIRLRKYLEWSIPDVGRALAALGVVAAADLDLRFLRRLGQAVRLRDDLGLSLPQTLSFWADIDTYGADKEAPHAGSLYGGLFLSRTIRDLAVSPETFGLNEAGTDLTTHGSITANRTAIQAALRISAADLDGIQATVGFDDRLTLGNLSALHRYAVLARALGASVRDLLDLQALTGINPFAPPAAAPGNADPTVQEGTERFVELARKVARSRFSLTLLKYLYQDREDPAGAVGLRREELDRQLTALRTGLRAIGENAGTPVANAEGDIDAERLDRLLAQVLTNADGIERSVALLRSTAAYAVRLIDAPPPFPEPLRSRIRHDASTGMLHFRGAMTSLERTALLALSSNDPYRRAIEDLYEQPRDIVEHQMGRFLPLDEAVARLIEDASATPETRIAYVEARAVDYLSTSFVIQTIAAALELEPAVARTLLTATRRSPEPRARPALEEFLSLRTPVATTPAPEPFPEAVQDAYSRLHKAALLVTTFGLDAREIAYITDHPTDFGDFDIHDLPVRETPTAAELHRKLAAWERWSDFVRLREGLRPGADLISVFKADSLAGANTALRNATGWDATDLDAAVGVEGWGVTATNFREFFKNEVRLRDVAAVMAQSRRLGVSPVRGFAWASSPVDAGIAREVQSAVKMKYEADQWLAVARHLNDPLRERRRDALIAHVLHRLRLGGSPIRTADELFEYFLIDVEMNACMATSRIKQAISSVQLFIQRCFMKLEDYVPPNVLRADWWKWMSTYRIWEANRKVFLYPENWIEPELRDDKSPFFRDLENELLQNDVTADTVEVALLSYLEKLDEVARLDIRAMYWEHESELTWDRRPPAADQPAESGAENGGLPDAEERADILHVFARTHGLPPAYYHRRWIDRHVWTPWEKLPADIEGDHLIPVVYNRRLYLFWPLFRETTDPPGDRVGPPQRRLEIELAWSEYKNGTWSAKKVTKEKLTPNYVDAGPDARLFYPTIEPRSEFFFDAREVDDVLVVECSYHHRTAREMSRVGQFAFVGCRGEVVATTVNELVDTWMSPDPLARPNACFVHGQQFASQSIPDPLTMLRSVESGAVVPLLELDRRLGGTTPYRIVYSHQYAPFELQAPFFYQDRRRAYFVTPEQVADVVTQIQTPGKVKLSLMTTVLPNWRSPAAAVLSAGQLAQVGLSATDVASIGLAPQVTGSTALQLLRDAPLHKGTAKGARWTETLACRGDPSPDSGARSRQRSDLKFRFHTFHHPHVCAFVKALNRQGVSGLLALDRQDLSDLTQDGDAPADPERLVFRQYRPTDYVDRRFPREDVDFEGGAYALYNWELFFHIPLFIATRLSANQRFDEARRWFHFIFDPTTDSIDSIPQRFWKTFPFYTNSRAPQERIGDLLRLLSYRGTDPELVARRAQVEAQVREWRDDPFNPHLIARLRPTAYQKTVVMKYIDNLIAWGDQLFQQDTIESINEATQLYMLASLMLGERPAVVPPQDATSPQSYARLRPRLDDFSNAVVAAENAVAGRRCAPLTPARARGRAGGGALGTLYFCVPHNDKLLGYWDRVQDRLSKIRHCMNIEGVVRQLPLFEPSIDPALLVRARAAGVDLRSALNDINAGLPHHRFAFMLQKALELCAEVRSLGAALLAAHEKKDAEELALLRSTHEIRMLEQALFVRQNQVKEADETIGGLSQSRMMAEAKRDYYRALLAATAGRTVTGERAPVTTPLNAQEALSLEKFREASDNQRYAGVSDTAAAILHIIPSFSFPGGGAGFGGPNLGAAAQAVGRGFSTTAADLSYDGTRASTMGGYTRRSEEWQFQMNQAEHELEQINRQTAAADIRKAIAQRELQNQELQIEQSRASDEFMRSRKFSRKELYEWMITQLSLVYFQAYELAYDMAKKAERASRFELGVTPSNVVRFGQWDSLRQGLLAGEQLALDLKRLEAVHLDRNRREYEISKQISLVLLDPVAVIALKETGRCVVRLPEAFFDLDYPGHYMRRIRSVSLTIPSVRGPYSGINCTLTLLNSRIRTENAPAVPYVEQADDSRFVRNFAAVQSIATSHAQNDSGTFELNFRDERYLPFEGAGVISEWRIDLPKDCNAFDFDTISDVILHLNYTSRDGGDRLRQEARMAVLPVPIDQPRREEALPRRGQDHLRRLFSARHEFADAWHRFLHAGADVAPQVLQLPLMPERFPFVTRGRLIAIKKVELFVRFREPAASGAREGLAGVVTPPGRPVITVDLEPDAVLSDPARKELLRALVPAGAEQWNLRPSDAPWLLSVVQRDGTVTRPYRLTREEIADLFIVCHYGTS